MTTPRDDTNNSQRGEVEGRLHPSLYPREFWEVGGRAFAQLIRSALSSSLAGQRQAAFDDAAPRPVDDEAIIS